MVSDLTPEPMQTVHAGVGTATIKRAILNFSLMPEEANTDATAAQIFYGIGVVTEDALAALAVPDPASDFNQDWYYWRAQTIKVQTTNGGDQFVSWEADIRSQRRLRGGYRLILVVQAVTAPYQTRVHAGMRLLWSQQP